MMTQLKKFAQRLGLAFFSLAFMVMPLGMVSAHQYQSQTQTNAYGYQMQYQQQYSQYYRNRYNNYQRYNQSYRMDHRRVSALRHHNQQIRFHDQEGTFMPQEIVIFDRDNMQNQIVLFNSLTGPNSRNINRVEIGMNHEDFNRISRNIERSQTITINANTGNNTVSFNTVVGNVSTGDVTISTY